MRQQLGNKEGVSPDKTLNYTVPDELAANYPYLGGYWTSRKDHAELASDEGDVALVYYAKGVNIVAGGNDSSVQVFVDGKNVDSSNAGWDVNGSVARISGSKLYNVVNGNYGQHLLLLRIKGKGFRLFTFTFG